MPSPLRIPWIHRGWTPAPMIVSNIRNWERNGTDSSRDPSECFCWHCDFRLLAFRTVREQISVVLSRLGYGNFLWQPWEIDTYSYAASLSSNCHGEHSFLGVFFNFSFHSMALTWFFSYVLFLSFLSYFFDTFQISICWSVLKICHRTSLFLPILSSWLTFASSWFYIPFRCCKESACNGGDLSWIPALGRSPGEGNGNPLQYSSLGNLMNRGGWQVTVNGVSKSQTRLSD